MIIRIPFIRTYDSTVASLCKNIVTFMKLCKIHAKRIIVDNVEKYILS